ncbi:hypothetical protein Cni_G01222 [Canna indica]|uniref:Uncharacterized protein n=1 Tax=Canna indica TaxID=4628 RepID=A0AAQ3JPA8_9LILI|nr:hypothetical protein Cni_G01222 [Canna indica]
MAKPSFFCFLRRPRFIFLLLIFAFLTSSALGRGQHVVTIPASIPFPSGLAWDATAQHFVVGSRLPPAAVSSVSDAGVSEVLISDPLLPSTSSVAALVVDDRRRRLLVALANPAALAAYDLRSPRPHRRLFLSPLPDPSAAPGGVTVDASTGAAFVTAGRVILKVDLDGTAALLSKSATYSADPSLAGLGGVAHVNHGYLLVVERGGAGRVFKVDEDDGATKEVLGKALATEAEGLAVRSDGGAVVARGGAGARWLRGEDAWGQAAVQDEAEVEEGRRAAAIVVREWRRAYVLVTPAVEGNESGEEKVSRIEEVEWKREGEGDMVWGFVLFGGGLVVFFYWRFQMRQLAANMNKKRA